MNEDVHCVRIEITRYIITSIIRAYTLQSMTCEICVMLAMHLLNFFSIATSAEQYIPIGNSSAFVNSMGQVSRGFAGCMTSSSKAKIG